MPGRLKRRMHLMLAALMIAATIAAPARAQASPRIVAVGDLHGDYEAYRAILGAADLIDARGRWTGGDAVFVQTGDIVDRGPDSLKVIRDLGRLKRQARRAGGRVVTLVGNHEAMNITGDLRYVHPGEYAAFADESSERRRERLYQANRAAIEASYRARDPAMTDEAVKQAWLEATPLGQIEHRAAWSPEGELGRWAIGNPAALVIGDTLFVHGGIGASYAHLSIEEINRRTASALAARDVSPGAIINDPLGPLWYRGLLAGGGESPVARHELDAILRLYGVRRMVVGHTPILGGIALLHGGRLIRIDTGIAPFYGGKRTYLEIRDGEAIPHVVEEGAR